MGKFFRVNNEIINKLLPYPFNLNMSKQIIFIGFILIIVGGLFFIIEKSGFNYDNPLDFKFEKGNTKIFLPIGSSILISIILSLFFYFIKKMF